jgi:hypothetical protein
MLKARIGYRTEFNPKLDEILGMKKDRIWNDPTSRAR